ncbi:MAG: hypothetical protein LH472_10320 [Pyrinomonadaceae bacterium]|nr:hypothetical protein [Pyrinomonadaceae bacterium]
MLRKIGFLVSLTTFLAIAASAQNVNVTATGGTANATYATVKAVFDAVNAGTHTSAITMEVSPARPNRQILRHFCTVRARARRLIRAF